MKITRRKLRRIIRESLINENVEDITSRIQSDISILIKGNPSAPNETRISNRHMNKTQARILEGVLDYYMSLERYRYAAIVDLINASIQMGEEGQWDIRDAVNLVSDEDLGDATRAFKTYMVHPHVFQNIPVSGGSFLSRLSDVPDPEGLENLYR